MGEDFVTIRVNMAGHKMFAMPSVFNRRTIDSFGLAERVKLGASKVFAFISVGRDSN